MRPYPSSGEKSTGHNTLKPFAVYKLSKAESALHRLDGAVARLESALRAGKSGTAADGASVPGPDAEREIAALKAEVAALTALSAEASERVGATVARLKKLLED